MGDFFQRHERAFDKLFKTKQYLHLYTDGCGMDPYEFQNAQYEIKQLITEYQGKMDALQQYKKHVDEEDEYEDEHLSWLENRRKEKIKGYDYIGPFREKYTKYNQDIVRQFVALNLASEQEVMQAMDEA